MSGKLNVWWGQTLVATLAERRGRMSCTYTDPSMPMFSVAMPTRSAPYPDRFTRPFFHGLLPEGDARRIIAFDLGLGNGGGTDMDLLRALGRDCAGALVIAQGKPHPSALDGIAHGLSSEQIAQRLRDLPDHPLGADGLVRVSLPGVQPKLLLGRAPAGEWYLPAEGRASTHLLKPAHRFLAGSIPNELLCQRFAAAADVSAATTEMMAFAGEPALVSTRFDREFDASGVSRRLHQEDACQALMVLTVDPRRKYQQGAGPPSLRGVAEVLDRWGDGPQRVRLLEQVVVNMVVGNADLHGKNLSLLHREGVVSLAPYYDVMSTTALSEDVSTGLGLFVGDATDINEVTMGDVAAEGVSWGLRPVSVDAVIGGLLDRMPDALVAAAATAMPPDGSFSEQLLDHIGGRLRRARTNWTTSLGRR